MNMNILFVPHKISILYFQLWWAFNIYNFGLKYGLLLRMILSFPYIRTIEKNIENCIDVLHILPQYIFHNIRVSCKLLLSSVLDNSNSNGLI